MIIELFGLPGSGKSTFAAKLLENKGYVLIKIRSRFELLFYNLLYLIKHPFRFLTTLLYIVRNSHNWNLFYYKFTNCFLHYNAKYQKALRFRKALIDQGYFQNIISVFEKRLTEKELREYIDWILRPDILFVFDILPAEAAMRMKKRGRIPRQEFGENYLKMLGIAFENASLFKKIILDFDLEYNIIKANKSSEDIFQDAKAFIESKQSHIK